MEQKYVSPAPPYSPPAQPPAPLYPSPVKPPIPPSYQTPPLSRKPVCPSDRRDSALAGILFLLTVLSSNLSLFGGFHLGYTISCLATILCGVLYLGRRLNRLTAYGILCITAAVAATGLFVWHNDGTMRFYAFCGITLLTMLALLDCTGTFRRNSGTLACLIDAFHMLLVRPFTHMGTSLRAIFLVKRGEQIEKRRFGGALLGLLCALPVLLVVVPLLVSADAAFEGLLQHTVLDNFGEIFASLFVGLGLFCLIFSRLFSLRHDLPETAYRPAPPRKGIPTMAVNAFLGTISGVYALYLFSQLAYFFSAFSGILPEEYTVAQYARRGFFEMAVLCAINLGLVAMCLFLSRKQKDQAPLSTRLIALFILVFSLGLVVVALSKMALYIGSFGMTRLRILTGVFMLMMAAVLLFVIVRLFACRFPYMKATVVTIAVCGLVVGYTDVDTFIARYNVHAYETQALETLDVSHLTTLSDGAVPYMVELWQETEDDTIRTQLTDALYFRLWDHGEFDYNKEDESVFIPDPAPDFRAYNIDAVRARTLLLTHADAIVAAYERQWEEETYWNDHELQEDREEDSPLGDDSEWIAIE